MNPLMANCIKMCLSKALEAGAGVTTTIISKGGKFVPALKNGGATFTSVAVICVVSGCVITLLNKGNQ